MIPTLIARLIASGVPARVAKPLLIAGAVIGAALLLWFVVAHIIRNHDEAVIEKHDAKVNADVIERVQDMDRVAADQRVKDARQEERDRAELEKVTTNEAISLPDRRRQYYDRVREQQAASRRADAADR